MSQTKTQITSRCTHNGDIHLLQSSSFHLQEPMQSLLASVITKRYLQMSLNLLTKNFILYSLIHLLFLSCEEFARLMFK